MLVAVLHDAASFLDNFDLNVRRSTAFPVLCLYIIWRSELDHPHPLRLGDCDEGFGQLEYR
jgi:hypothetical protein